MVMMMYAQPTVMFIFRQHRPWIGSESDEWKLKVNSFGVKPDRVMSALSWSAHELSCEYQLGATQNQIQRLVSVSN